MVRRRKLPNPLIDDVLARWLATEAVSIAIVRNLTNVKAVKVSSIKNGFRKAGIASGTDDDASQTSDISDDEQITSTAILDPVLDAQLMDLFNSDTEDEDFNGF